MRDCKITFIGGGNMARSLIGGLITDGFNPQHIHVADPEPLCLQALTDQYPVHTFSSNIEAVKDCEVVILAVKPQQLQAVVKQLAPHLKTDALLISIAAGIRLDDIARWLEQVESAIVRAMPNTPSLVQAGATALFANEHVSDAQHELAESILRSVGLALWVDDEVQIDAVTALSGSGPAYFFLVMEAMESAAVEMGLTSKTARLLCLQTAFGAAKMALESDETTTTLRERVTSPGGTTERAIHELEDGGLRGLFENALIAAALRSRELANQLGEDNA
ncbi:MAG: pyrroline-5-carboxylate reductase [Gammaproteobacteria bacterium]|nr:MAG: pyrroline-5-carboxylate reductase [Gammaproteobacteria bacterium]RKZ94595.1 MAG: pyrroline-5-carboxylate reductase [Gammaproteobacteria bacterium]RKZ97634.1 MAG: pyrroline-5-carboxylate reductase [Gammaproteobacteria bacterium]RLA00138.1 MAG: pyrroline-5-carboxylate reductase [Gammaproteobacteria bacterium]